MQELDFIILAAAILGFGLVSGRLEKSVLTPPMVFTALGIALSPAGLGVLDMHVHEGAIHLLAEVTLVLILFTDASRIDLRLLWREHNLPVRLLAVGLPLCIAAGTLAALQVFESFSLWEAAVLAVILSPTDAALGQTVVASPNVPQRIRQTLNAESGLNDGIVLPVLLVVLSLAIHGFGEHEASHWLRLAGMQLVLGPLVGVGVALGMGKLIEVSTKTGWMSHAFQDLASIGLSLLAFALAEVVGGNGFIAAFCAGLTLGNAYRGICTCLYEFAEAEGQLLSLLIFMLFAVLMVPLLFEGLGWRPAVYALLSLTVVRMLPSAFSLIGAGLRWESIVFVGWFGPRGLASILFTLLVLEYREVPHMDLIEKTVVLTVLASVFAHGLTAFPAAKWYGGRMAALEPEQCEQERSSVGELPLRIPYGRKPGSKGT